MGTLSDHFDWDDVTRSDTAARNGIDNSLPDELKENVLYTAAGMDAVRDYLNAPVHVNSWYRGSALEYHINKVAYESWCLRSGRTVDTSSWQLYFERKSHPKGQAVDFVSPAYGSAQKVFDALRVSGIRFDQLILEFGTWVHASFVQGGGRGQLLVINNSGTHVWKA